MTTKPYQPQPSLLKQVFSFLVGEQQPVKSVSKPQQTRRIRAINAEIDICMTQIDVLRELIKNFQEGRAILHRSPRWDRLQSNIFDDHIAIAEGEIRKERRRKRYLLEQLK